MRCFILKLAAHLGKTVRELLETTSSSEISEWQAFDRIDPFGESRADLRNAILCQTIAASRGVETTLSDFMPDFEPAKPPAPQPVEEQLAWIRAISEPFLKK